MENPSIEIKVDTTQLDEALRKMELLCERAEKAESMLAVTVAALAAATATQKPVSRRSLLGLNIFGDRAPFEVTDLRGKTLSEHSAHPRHALKGT